MATKNKKEKSKIERLQEEATVKMVGYILASFGLVAGLAWNEAIKAYIEIWFPSTDNSAPAKLIYAIVLSTIVVLISIGISNVLVKMKDN